MGHQVTTMAILTTTDRMYHRAYMDISLKLQAGVESDINIPEP
jgi:hypothetical protein